MFYHYASTVCFVNNHNLYSGLVLPSLLETEFNYNVDVTASLKTSDSFLIGGFGSISDTLSIRLVNDAVVMPDQVEILFLME